VAPRTRLQVVVAFSGDCRLVGQRPNYGGWVKVEHFTKLDELYDVHAALPAL